MTTDAPFALTVDVDRVQSNQNGGGGFSFGSNTFEVVSRCVAVCNAGRGILLAEGVLTESTAVANGTIGLQINYGTIRGCVSRANDGSK